MGHITVLAETAKEAHEKAQKVNALISFKPTNN
jgi:hypothetical protein